MEDSTSTLTCERHGNATPLTCVRCEAPICWGCLVETDVGFMCERHGRRTRRSRSLPAERRQRLVAGGALVASVALVVVAARAVGGGGASPPPPRPVVYEAVAGLPDNAGFEDGAGPAGEPAGWNRGAGPGYEVALDQDVRHGGGASARLRAVEPGGTAEGRRGASLSRCIPAAPVAGGTLRLRAFLRTEGATGRGTGLSLLVLGERLDGRPGVLDSAGAGRIALPATRDWTEYRVQVAVGPAAVEVCLGAALTGQGTLWVDDLVLERASRAGPAARPE